MRYAEGNDHLSEAEFDAALLAGGESWLDRLRGRFGFYLIARGYQLLPQPGRDVQLSMVQRGAECYGVGSSLDLDERFEQIRETVGEKDWPDVPRRNADGTLTVPEGYRGPLPPVPDDYYPEGAMPVPPFEGARVSTSPVASARPIRRVPRLRKRRKK